MTITTEPAPLSYDGDDSTIAFAISWKYFAKSDVVVTHRDASAVETTWVLDTDYTLTAAGVGSGGTLTATTAPVTGAKIVIDLNPPNTQDSSLPLGGPFPSTTIEDELDQAAQRDAKLEALFDRVFLVPKTDTQTGSLDVPIDSARANKFWANDANGKLIMAAGTSADLKPVSAFVDTLLDDADAGAFLTTLLITAFAQTLLDDTTAVAARQTLLVDKSGADIASAATIDLDAATGDFVDVTGTVTITAITLGDGVEKTVRFAGILTLTNGASLVLPDSADIQTAAGDIAIFRGDASSVVRLISYQHADAPTSFGPQLKTSVVASGTAVDFTSIPSWVRKVIIMFDELSLSGTDNFLIQLGDSGGFETTGYVSSAGFFDGSAGLVNNSTAGFIVVNALAAAIWSGQIILTLINGNRWISSHAGKNNTTRICNGGGSKTLSAVLTQIRITRTGTDTFDSGSINVRYER